MTFDFGGFLGGLIGVVGAYGVAIYSFKKQTRSEKPAKNRRIYDLSISISQTLDLAWWDVDSEDTYKFSQLMKKILDNTYELKKHIPQAIETDNRILKVITETIESIDCISKKWSAASRTHENYIGYQQEILNIFTSNKKICDEISSGILQTLLRK